MGTIEVTRRLSHSDIFERRIKQSQCSRLCLESTLSQSTSLDVPEKAIAWGVDASLAVRTFFKRNRRQASFELRHNSRKPPVSDTADMLAHGCARARDTIFEVIRGCQGVLLRFIGRLRDQSRPFLKIGPRRVIAPRVARYSIPATRSAHTRHFRCVIGYQTAANDGKSGASGVDVIQ